MSSDPPVPSHYRFVRQIQGRCCFAEITVCVEPVTTSDQAETCWEFEIWPDLRAGIELGIAQARTVLSQPLHVTLKAYQQTDVDTTPQAMALAACHVILQAMGEPLPTNYAEQLKAYADLLGE